MEGNGGGGAPAPPCDLGMTYWAPCASTFPSPTGGQQQHLTCLKLGKRPCYWGEEYPEAAGGGVRVSADGGGAVGAPEGIRRKEKGVEVAPVPRCQVEGCHVALTGAKEYHRRHKVCEPHSKAPRVVVLGAVQRFCQQCSRFHAIAEFDNAKRSCRRRLAGHNERRRKSNAGEAAASLSAHPYGFPYFPTTSPSGALSLLSSRVTPWLIPTADVSARSSAALDELIAENRAAILAWQFFSDRSGRPAALTASCNAGMAGWPHGPHHCQLPPRPDHAGNGIGHVTLDLMQATTTGAPVRSVSDGSKSKDADADCYDIWKSLEGAHVV